MKRRDGKVAAFPARDSDLPTAELLALAAHWLARPNEPNRRTTVRHFRELYQWTRTSGAFVIAEQRTREFAGGGEMRRLAIISFHSYLQAAYRHAHEGTMHPTVEAALRPTLIQALGLLGKWTIPFGEREWWMKGC